MISCPNSLIIASCWYFPNFSNVMDYRYVCCIVMSRNSKLSFSSSPFLLRHKMMINGVNCIIFKRCVWQIWSGCWQHRLALNQVFYGSFHPGAGVNWFPSGALLSIYQNQTSGPNASLCLPGPLKNWLICEGHFPILDKWFHKYVRMSGFRPGHNQRPECERFEIWEW